MSENEEVFIHIATVAASYKDALSAIDNSNPNDQGVDQYHDADAKSRGYIASSFCAW